MQQSEVFERARLSRDARFDGQFFVGVKTTGIYCRPICPANAPKSKNVSFYQTAAAASEAGFRPCLRCRPECAPGSPAWNGTSTTVRRGLRLIANGVLDDGNVENLADKLGVTSRHLRRLFNTHVGASPLAVAHTQRLHFAKRLIDDTTLPMAEIALASGYGSIRRFNDAFRNTYQRSPRDLRRVSSNVQPGTALTVRLPYRKPFDWDSQIKFFGGRAIPGVESVDGGRYLRTVDVDGEPGVLEFSHDGGDGFVLLTLHGVSTASLFPIVQRSREIFDLDAPVADIASVLSRDLSLKAQLRSRPGIRVPGSWDGFELAVRAILGQQVSVKAATTMSGRIARKYGKPVDVPYACESKELTHLFPSPQKLARARFTNIGLVTSRADTIRRVAKAVCDGKLSFESSQDPDEFCSQLTDIHGIGDWTAQYVAMRALKNPDAFPSSDLGLLRAFDESGKDRMKPTELSHRAETWRPWRAYAALLLWSSDTNSGG